MERNDYGLRPTIGDCRALGAKGVTVFCARLYCPHSGAVPWYALGLPDDVTILDIARRRTFACTRCGTRNQVEVRVDWPFSGGAMGGTWGMPPPGK